VRTWKMALVQGARAWQQHNSRAAARAIALQRRITLLHTVLCRCLSGSPPSSTAYLATASPALLPITAPRSRAALRASAKTQA